MIADEKIIAALLTQDSVRDAAKSLSISEKTIYERLRKPPFIQMYRDAKTSMLKRATRAFNERLSDVAVAVYKIATDESVNAAVRLQACQTICNMFVRFRDIADSAEVDVITCDDPITTGLDNEIQKMLERSNNA